MINLSTITKALHTQLSNSIPVANLFSSIALGEVINSDPSRAPWMGIYRGKTTYEPRTLGSMNNWEAFPSLIIIIQAVDLRSAEECEKTLEGYVKTVMDAIIKDTTIEGTVDIITGFEIEPGYIETERSTMHFQATNIILNLEVATQ